MLESPDPSCLRRGGRARLAFAYLDLFARTTDWRRPIERIYEEITDETLKIRVVRSPMLQYKNITFSFFPPDPVQQQPIRGCVVITNGWVIAY